MIHIELRYNKMRLGLIVLLASSSILTFVSAGGGAASDVTDLAGYNKLTGDNIGAIQKPYNQKHDTPGNSISPRLQQHINLNKINQNNGEFLRSEDAARVLSGDMVSKTKGNAGPELNNKYGAVDSTLFKPNGKRAAIIENKGTEDINMKDPGKSGLFQGASYANGAGEKKIPIVAFNGGNTAHVGKLRQGLIDKKKPYDASNSKTDMNIRTYNMRTPEGRMGVESQLKKAVGGNYNRLDHKADRASMWSKKQQDAITGRQTRITDRLNNAQKKVDDAPKNPRVQSSIDDKNAKELELVKAQKAQKRYDLNKNFKDKRAEDNTNLTNLRKTSVQNSINTRTYARMTRDIAKKSGTDGDRDNRIKAYEMSRNLRKQATEAIKNQPTKRKVNTNLSPAKQLRTNAKNDRDDLKRQKRGGLTIKQSRKASNTPPGSPTPGKKLKK